MKNSIIKIKNFFRKKFYKEPPLKMCFLYSTKEEWIAKIEYEKYCESFGKLYGYEYSILRSDLLTMRKHQDIDVFGYKIDGELGLTTFGFVKSPEEKTPSKIVIKDYKNDLFYFDAIDCLILIEEDSVGNSKVLNVEF